MRWLCGLFSCKKNNAGGCHGPDFPSHSWFGLVVLWWVRFPIYPLREPGVQIPQTNPKPKLRVAGIWHLGSNLELSKSFSPNVETHQKPADSTGNAFPLRINTADSMGMSIDSRVVSSCAHGHCFFWQLAHVDLNPIQRVQGSLAIFHGI